MHAIPISHSVDVTVTQEDRDRTDTSRQASLQTVSGSGGGGKQHVAPWQHTWRGYRFSNVSNWVSTFLPGSGSLQIWESTGGVRGKLLYSTRVRPALR